MEAALRQTDYKQTYAEVHAVDDGEGYASHIRSALQRGLPELPPAVISHDGTFVLVGSGPSLPRFADEIRAERELGRPICAVKGAHDWLVGIGVVPDLWISAEPQDRSQQLLKPQDDTVYLPCSMCHPAVFEALQGRKMLLWHPWTAQTQTMPELKGKPLIGGGTTTGLRAITFAYVLFGFRKFVLYGYDSCLAEDRKTKRYTGEMAGKVVDRIVGQPPKTFYCNGAMAMQADEFMQLWGVMPDLRMQVKGDGLLAAIHAEAVRLGYKV